MALARLRPIAYLAGHLMATGQAVALANRLGMADDRLVSDEVIDEQFLPFGSPRFTGACFELIEHLKSLRNRSAVARDRHSGSGGAGRKGPGLRTAVIRRLLERLPECAKVVHSDCGHVVQRERPRALARAISPISFRPYPKLPPLKAAETAAANN